MNTCISGSKLNLKALTRTYGSINRNDRTIIHIVFISVLECMKDVDYQKIVSKLIT